MKRKILASENEVQKNHQTKVYSIAINLVKKVKKVSDLRTSFSCPFLLVPQNKDLRIRAKGGGGEVRQQDAGQGMLIEGSVLSSRLSSIGRGSKGLDQLRELRA